MSLAARGPVRVGIAADDLTGAADSLAQFCNLGWESRLLVAPGPVQEPGGERVAIARSLDSRALADDAAARITADAVSGGLGRTLDRVYVKIDSTLRGSVNGQIQGALGAWSQRFSRALAFICPAYPQMGRTIFDGRMWVRGVPLHLSAAGQDPLLPVGSSVLTDLIAGAQVVSAAATCDELVQRLRGIARPGARIVLEASSKQDLDVVAGAIDAFGPDAVPVGSGGLAASLAKVWGAPRPGAVRAARPVAGVGRVIVAVTSLNEMSLAQAERLADDFGARVERHMFTLQELAHPDTLRIWAAPAVSVRKPPIVLLQPQADRTPGTDPEVAALGVARGIALVVEGLVAAGDAAGLVLVGGDGARAVLAALGVSAVRLCGSITEGVPWGHLAGGIAPGLMVATKAGGFGAADTLSYIVSVMQGGNGK